MPSHTPFGPSTRRSGLSNHPKTILNRAYKASKDPLERAISRDNVAFRKAKSRRLTAFRSSKEWSHLTERDRERAEHEIIDLLIAVRDTKKREHEMEWRHKVEADEEEDQGKDFADSECATIDNAENDDEDDWTDEDSDEGDIDTWDGKKGAQGLIHSVGQIKRLWGVGYWKQVAEVERVAKQKEAE